MLADSLRDLIRDVDNSGSDSCTHHDCDSRDCCRHMCDDCLVDAVLAAITTELRSSLLGKVDVVVREVVAMASAPEAPRPCPPGRSVS